MATTPNNNNPVATRGGTPGVAVPAANPSPPPPPKSQRGHNKPKCKQCGNVARSRCPYECCKSCCARNQNPCHIHVLKANSTVPEKTPSSGAAPLDQQSLELPHSTNAGRAASLRQLSNSFAQFNNLHLSLRSKKPLTRKDAEAINEWRFAKLKEYKERNIEVENEAFDRYMQNVDLLEEVLAVQSSDDNVSSASESNPASTENNETMIPWLKLQISSNSMRSNAVRTRVQQIVDEGLMKLQNSAVDGEINEPMDEADEVSKSGKGTERLSALNDLMDKINKARTEEDLKLCLELKSQLFDSSEGSGIMEGEGSEMLESGKAAEPARDETPAIGLNYSLPKMVVTNEIDQETLNIVDKHFCSLEDVEEL
ncbi:uncharacterized protein LOC130715050 [Lotus japonicus]|uniref:uncharacterized protein LOC130715050 n=1 Tax=Lotus japonicus TaxID=34305 RepID=UPI0025830952|nr:uncharacterized protein LOC130715050 [Lotus japonicus]